MPSLWVLRFQQKNFCKKQICKDTLHYIVPKSYHEICNVLAYRVFSRVNVIMCVEMFKYIVSTQQMLIPPLFPWTHYRFLQNSEHYFAKMKA